MLYLFIQRYFLLCCWQSGNISVTSGNGSTFPSRRLYYLQPVKKQPVSRRNLPKLMVWSRRSSLFVTAVNRPTGSSLSTLTNYYVFIGAELPIADKEKILRYARSTKKQIFFVPTLYELACKNTGFLLVDDIPMQRVTRMLLTAEQRVLKRILDIAVVVTALIILSPVMLITAVMIKLDSKGPVLYSQERVGLYGKTFFVHKFRSMKQDAEAKCGPVLAAEGDPRITKFGRFMRATRLDELPQLFNVLKGEMSIVGPRPERPVFVKQFIAQKPEYDYRHNVKPGITGLAQIAGKYNTSAYDKLIYDLLYIQDVSIKTDLMIMLQTFKVLLTKSSTEGVKQ